MDKFLKQNLLLISVFITGACVLIIEVVAVRVLSPHYGNTIFTVSSVISVILAALSIGYYAGGKFADRHPSLRWFFGSKKVGRAKHIPLISPHFSKRIWSTVFSPRSRFEIPCDTNSIFTLDTKRIFAILQMLNPLSVSWQKWLFQFSN